MRLNIQKFFSAIFAPPFRSLPLVVWLYYVWCFLAHPGSQILLGNLPDADDYMYLAQISDWLNGQSWFDIVQHRLNPPDGVAIDFSRLTQIPMAILVLLLRPLLGLTAASLVMAAILPPLWLALLFLALRWTAETFQSKNWARVTSFIALFATYLIYQFSPGHIDHHGLTALLVTVAFGFTMRMIRQPDLSKWAVGAGFFLALALAVALEILPWLIVIVSWVGVWAMQKGHKAARAGAVLSLSLFLSSFLFLIITKAPHHWFDIDTMAYSAVYVVFTSLIALCFAGLAFAERTRVALRYVIGVLSAAVSGLIFLSYFPELVGGPYGGVNPELAKLMFDSITEAMPIAKSATSAIEVFLRLVWPVMAFAVSVYFFRRAKKDERWLWGLLLYSLTAAILLATFYQIRCMVFAQLFSVLAMSAALQRAMIWLGKNCPIRALAFMQLGLLLVIAPLPMLIFPALVDNRPFNTGMLMFPVVKASEECDMRSLIQALDKQSLNTTHLMPIMNEMDSGSELLFRTPYSVLGAPYHTNVGGNLDSAHFFTSADPIEARDIMQRRKAGLVVICRAEAAFYVNPQGKSFAQRLVDGEVPHWLNKVDYPGERDFLLFELNTPSKGGA